MKWCSLTGYKFYNVKAVCCTSKKQIVQQEHTGIKHFINMLPKAI